MTANQHQTNAGAISGKAVLQALGLKLGDRILVNGVKIGTLRSVPIFIRKRSTFF